MTPDITGALILALPALVLAYALLWRRQPAFFWFAASLILVGTGYLWASGAAGDIGRRWGPAAGAAPVVNPAPAK